MKVLNFGSLNLDYVYSVDHMVAAGETLASFDMRTFCGGKGLNQSIALAKAGVAVYHAGLIGEEGEELLMACRQACINTKFIRKIDEKCGHTIIQVDKSGQNCILLYGGANQCISKEFVDEVLAEFDRGDILLLQNEINQLAYIISKAYEKGMQIIMNPSPFNEHLKECDLSKISMFLINEIEGEQISGQKEADAILRELKKKFPKSKVVLTLGKEGSLYQDEDTCLHQKIYPVETVDTTAAGDTFTGFFIASMLEGMPTQEGLDMAARAASIAVSRKGAASSIPLREEVESM